MSTPVNLNRFRKAKARADKKARAEENAIKFGLSKSDKTQATKLKTIQERRLDGVKKEE